MPSPRLTTRAGSRTGSSSWYRHRSGGREAISSRVTVTLSRSYRASSGAPSGEVPWTTSASCREPSREHSRWEREEKVTPASNRLGPGDRPEVGVEQRAVLGIGDVLGGCPGLLQRLLGCRPVAGDGVP